MLRKIKQIQPAKKSRAAIPFCDRDINTDVDIIQEAPLLVNGEEVHPDAAAPPVSNPGRAFRADTCSSRGRVAQHERHLQPVIG